MFCPIDAAVPATSFYQFCWALEFLNALTTKKKIATLGRKPIAFAHDENTLCDHSQVKTVLHESNSVCPSSNLMLQANSP